MKCIIAILITGFCISALSGTAEEAEKQDLVLDLTCNLPASGLEVDSGVVVARLYEYDPRLADAAATEIAKVTVSGLTHKKGKNTVLRIPLYGKRSAQKNYYVTVFIHPSTGTQRLYFIDGFQKVFSSTDDETLQIMLKPVAQENK